MENIEITNIKLLDGKEKILAEKLFPEYLEKLKRQVNNEDAILKVHIKKYDKEGKRKKYDIAVKLEFAMNVFKAKDFDWDFARTIHKVMNKLKEEIEHKLKTSEQY